MGRGRSDRQVPCDDCIRQAAAGSDGLSLCEECVATLDRRKSRVLPTEKTVQHDRPLGTEQQEVEGTITATSDDDPESFGESAELSPAVVSRGSAKLAQGGGTSQHTADSSTEFGTSADILRAYSQLFINAVNNRDFENPIWYRAATQVRVNSFDRYEGTKTLADNLDTFRQIVKDDPDYRLHLLHMDVIEKGDGKSAETYVNMEVTGRPAGLVMNSIGRLGWKRSHGDWLLTSFTAMRFSDMSSCSINGDRRPKW